MTHAGLMTSVVLLLFAGLWDSTARAHDRIEFDFDTGMTKRLSERMALTVEEEFWGNSAITGDDTWLVASFAATPWLAVEPFFCYGTDQSEHHLSREYRYGANLVMQQKLNGWHFHWRSHWALRDIEAENRLRQHSRNRFTVRPPISWTDYHIGPYMQYESFFENRQHLHGAADRFNGHRAVVAVSADLTENISFAVFYIRHWSRAGDEWNQRNILGTVLWFSY